ncbi:MULTISPECIES: hypothetical protein [Burkholderia cepacia complex]|uniref:hypothetical protein n=1 Tax=Burkholderia cepacia complex TaxID=87882 RepID=UPI0013DE1DB2|nr:MULTISPECIES: hypothetical protein [Burkholderia cepacia complex]
MTRSSRSAPAVLIVRWKSPGLGDRIARAIARRIAIHFQKNIRIPFFARLAHVLSACNVAPMVVIDAVQENIISAIKAVIENGRLAAKGLRGAAQRGTVSRVVRPGWCVAKDPDEWPIELENGWAEWLLIRIIEW